MERGIERDRGGEKGGEMEVENIRILTEAGAKQRHPVNFHCSAGSIVHVQEEAIGNVVTAITKDLCPANGRFWNKRVISQL